MPGSQIEDKEIVTVFHGQGYLGLPDFMIAQRVVGFLFFFKGLQISVNQIYRTKLQFYPTQPKRIQYMSAGS